MHEFSLIDQLMKTLFDSARENGIVKINRVSLVVGEAYGALPDALKFAFEVLSSGTPAGGAVLDVKEDPVVCRCSQCQFSYLWRDSRWKCPGCGSASADVTGGRGIYIEYFEGDEEGFESGCGGRPIEGEQPSGLRQP